ncbi:MAG: formyltetrahydrofolate deformylase [Sphingobium sp.]|jgi:formyltetrahydrofolate deformylase|uniref:Formyltetrahydrofolate deformylase n=1 Tax=Sphingobium xenophagum TaxID=121428 RepID=A0A401IX79_SPHXE|nr:MULTISPECIES: formyltetrahydrofolate deformylase [Sphingobium]MBU0658513.1 formyltetrahydrofolate deformylase [Alphaproteobacteria bacterium]MBA4755309.1 formyltetrahydrofolate deformylase [Sphingobium sp.]MBS90012.1 formyltetrahydrofolate deformylase [Sphingobium sp.]MBU0775582.1 formyltetrahydrofolate deformylase [Alphaproteobacteria bacterium]MBU0869901.1 formyltetrahydrofolate deformylase [Alphaproteobacteria bacterium]
MSEKAYIIQLSCDDQPGIVANVTTIIASLGANILESNQFWDRQADHFFLRIAITVPAEVTREAVARALEPSIDRFKLDLKVTDVDQRPKIIIMVSKFDHAMHHLLYQIKVNWLNAEVVAIVSNHEASRAAAEIEGIAYYHWPVTKENKAEQEEKLLNLVSETGAELVVLARYMQVLSNELSSKLFGKIINIHHSFLPSFKGAKPYHQAHERGVKLIGATAHYVTPDLDEGPIIEQETQRVSHSLTSEDFVATGRDIESRVLARAVKYHLEGRVMLNSHRTVVFTP